MTEALPWVKWRFDKWRGDAGLRMCGLAARGLWIDLLAIMHEEGVPYGHLTVNGRAPTPRQIASLVGMTSEREVAKLIGELEDAGVFSRTIDDDAVIYSRRLVRDKAARDRGVETGSAGGNPMLVKRLRNPEDQPPPLTEGLTPPVMTDKEREKRESNTPLAPKRGETADGQFEAFWAAYPHKRSKGHARKAFAKAIRLTSLGDMLEAIKRQTHYWQREPDKQPHPATWLNGERWLEVGSPANGSGVLQIPGIF